MVAVAGFFGCATGPEKKAAPAASEQATIESIRFGATDGGGTRVDITSSRSTPFTAFKLIDPPRVVIDLFGEPGPDLPPVVPVQDGNVKEIRLDETQKTAMTTRLVVGLTKVLDYSVFKQDRLITLTLNPAEKEPVKSPSPDMKGTEEGAEPTDIKTSETGKNEPRIFFKPHPDPMAQVLGLDFTMLDQGKSRLTVTTDKKAPYTLKRKDGKTVHLTLEGVMVPSLLLRRLDSTHFEGAVDHVKTTYSTESRKLDLAVILREMVPYHVNPSEKAIQVDFGATTVKPPEIRIVPLKMAENQKRQAVSAPEVKNSNAPSAPTVEEGKTAPAPPAMAALQKAPPSMTGAPSGPVMPGMKDRVYTGTPMTMDFVNADVTNILRLIGEISNLNIIWGPEVKGTVSMRLKKVPWDQALDLVLANNDLGMRREGNVIWVTTRAKIKQIEAEEKRKLEEARAAAEAERERKKKEKEEAKELEPLVTDYLSLDFAGAEEIKGHIDPILTDRGTTSVDERTNTIIIKDIAGIIEEAREIVKRFDTPVKQIVIEARIVDATANFSRDLGVQWKSLDGTNAGFERMWQHREGAGFGTDPTNFAENGDLTFGSEFSTNAPEGWGANLGLSLARLTNRGLGTLALDASLALAESEGTAKVISAPKVIAREGTSATISRGDQIIIPATENVASTTLDATLSLTVTPTKVSFNDYITLDVKVTDDQAPTTSRILKKAINTTLMFKSGETVVIGGIFKESKGKDEAGVPWLKEVPFLGWLFKAQRKNTERSELLIFLTPTVLPAGT